MWRMLCDSFNACLKQEDAVLFPPPFSIFYYPSSSPFLNVLDKTIILTALPLLFRPVSGIVIFVWDQNNRLTYCLPPSSFHCLNKTLSFSFRPHLFVVHSSQVVSIKITAYPFVFPLFLHVSIRHYTFLLALILLWCILSLAVCSEFFFFSGAVFLLAVEVQSGIINSWLVMIRTGRQKTFLLARLFRSGMSGVHLPHFLVVVTVTVNLPLTFASIATHSCAP